MDVNHQMSYPQYPQHFPQHWQQQHPSCWKPHSHESAMPSHYSEKLPHNKFHPNYGHEPVMQSTPISSDAAWSQGQSMVHGLFPNPHLQESDEITTNQQLQAWNRRNTESHWKQMPAISLHAQSEAVPARQHYPEMQISRNNNPHPPEKYPGFINIVPLPTDMGHNMEYSHRRGADLPRYGIHEHIRAQAPVTTYDIQPGSMHMAAGRDDATPPHNTFSKVAPGYIKEPLASMKRMSVPRSFGPLYNQVVEPDDPPNLKSKQSQFMSTDRQAHPLAPPKNASMNYPANVTYSPWNGVNYQKSKDCTPPRFVMPSYLSNFFRLTAQITRFYYSFIQYGHTPVETIQMSFGDGITVNLNESSLASMGPERYLVCHIAHMYRRVHPYLPKLFFGQDNQKQALKFCVWYEDEAASLSMNKGVTPAQTKVTRLSFLKMVLLELETYCMNLWPVDKSNQQSAPHRKEGPQWPWTMPPQPYVYQKPEYDRHLPNINDRNVANEYRSSHKQQTLSHDTTASKHMVVWPDSHPSQINIHTVVRIQPPAQQHQKQHTSSPQQDPVIPCKRWGRSQSDNGLISRASQQKRTATKRQRNESQPCRPPRDSEPKSAKRLKLEQEQITKESIEQNMKNIKQEDLNTPELDPRSMPSMEDFLNLTYMQEQLEKEAKDTIKKCLGCVDTNVNESRQSGKMPCAVDLTFGEELYSQKEAARESENAIGKDGDRKSDTHEDNPPDQKTKNEEPATPPDHSSPGNLVIDLTDMQKESTKLKPVDPLDVAGEKEVQGLVSSLGILPETARLMLQQRRTKKALRRLKQVHVDFGPIDLRVRPKKGCHQLPVQPVMKLVKDTEFPIALAKHCPPGKGMGKNALDFTKTDNCSTRELVGLEQIKTK